MTSGAAVWSEALPAPLPTIEPGASLRADVAIVGGGFTGLSTALQLLRARPGLRVVVLEAERIGAGASGRTTGMLGPGVGQSLGSLVARLGEQRATALYRATLRAVHDAAALITEERIDCELEMSGQLVVARHGSVGDRRRLGALRDLHHRLDLPGVALDDEALAARIRLAPPRHAAAADSRHGPAAIALPVAGLVHPGKLLAGLCRAASARGAHLFESARVLHLDAPHRSSIPSAARPVRLLLAGGAEVIADEVVVATAGYTAQLGLLRGRVLPVHLQVLATEPLDDGALEAVGWHGREGVLDARRLFNYFRLTADRRIVFGGGAPRYRWGGRTGSEATDDDAVLDRLARELRATFPAVARLAISHRWTGVIGYVADALPAIERLRDHPAVLHAVGWCGHGVALSLAAGGWIARLLEHGAPPEALPWYRSDPPLVPLEPVRWLGFRAAVGWMGLQDRWS